jgi:hypothetical protein
MCCFSGYPEGRTFHSVEKVSATNIFARSSNGNGRQILVYSMNLASQIDLAMILPLPVPAGCPEGAVRFISLEDYSHFFEHMKAGFAPDFDFCLDEAAVASPPKLQVHEVGDFEASYVPTMDDWDRLDERFRIPSSIFDALPDYRDFGFAVFKLKVTGRESEKPATKTIHPMAFEFPRADPDRLFFPTVHVHDGQFHPTAEFDHTLYCQVKPSGLPAWKRPWAWLRLSGWQRSGEPARSFLNLSKANGVIKPELYCYKKDIRGKRKNEDILVRDGN